MDLLVHSLHVTSFVSLDPCPLADRLPLLPLAKGILPFSVKSLADILERETFRFRDKECGEDSAEHEKCKDLHDMVEPFVVPTPITEWANESLGNYRTNFPGGSRDPMRSGTVPGRENLARNYKVSKG